MKSREQIQMTMFQLISSELVTRHEFKMSFLTKDYFVPSDTHIPKIRLIIDVTVEIFKIKNCSVGNLFKFTMTRHCFSDSWLKKETGIT